MNAEKVPYSKSHIEMPTYNLHGGTPLHHRKESQTISSEEKEAIVAEAKSAVQARYGKVPDRKLGLCLYYAIAFNRAMNVRGYQSYIQGGTMNWPVVSANNRSVSKFTHLGFVFEGPKSVKVATEQNRLPEMHCWNIIPASNEVVDLSVGELKELSPFIATEVKWDNEQIDPPPYLWAEWGKKNAFYDYQYSGHPQACFIAEMLVNKLYSMGDLDWLVKAIPARKAK